MESSAYRDVDKCHPGSQLNIALLMRGSLIDMKAMLRMLRVADAGGYSQNLLNEAYYLLKLLNHCSTDIESL